jgi:hypothetical protein
MKKLLIISMFAALVFLVSTISVSALMFNSGHFEGIYSGNENDYDLASLLGYGSSLSFSKYDVDEDKITGSFNITIEDLTEEGDPNQWGSFSSDYNLVGYTLKGGNNFALYSLNPAIAFGYWNTEHLENGGGQIPDLSHFIGGGVPPAPVPEPSTMLLLGTGLVGLIGFMLRPGFSDFARLNLADIAKRC